MLSVLRDLYSPAISADEIQAGIGLAEHYAAEALRLFGAGRMNADLLLAQRLLLWLLHHWKEPAISLPDIYQRSLNAIRDQATARKLVATLEDHGWLLRIPAGALLPGKDGTKRGVLCGRADMIPYRKFSDIQWGEFRTSQPPNPPKAPKVGDEKANDARTLDGLGALGAPTADSQNQPERDVVSPSSPNDLTGRKSAAGSAAAKAAKPAKDDKRADNSVASKVTACRLGRRRLASAFRRTRGLSGA